MEKIEGIRKNWTKVLFGVLTALAIAWTASPVHAVGPYFENESPPGGQTQGPNPAWPRPNEPLWSPPATQILSKESLKKGDIILRSSEQSGKAKRASADMVEARAEKHVALLDHGLPGHQAWHEFSAKEKP